MATASTRRGVALAALAVGATIVPAAWGRTMARVASVRDALDGGGGPRRTQAGEGTLLPQVPSQVGTAGHTQPALGTSQALPSQVPIPSTGAPQAEGKLTLVWFRDSG